MMYEVTVNRMGDEWRWHVEGILRLFELLDKLQMAFAPSEIEVAAGGGGGR